VSPSSSLSPVLAKKWDAELITCNKLANAFIRSGINASGLAHNIDGSPTPLVMVRSNWLTIRNKWGMTSDGGHLVVLDRLITGSRNF
jgi:hypothetical protein